MTDPTPALAPPPRLAPPRPALPNLCSLFLIFLLLANYVQPFGDLDFGLQVHAGEHILRTGRLRVPEPFTYTIHGQLLSDHEWLYDVALYPVWSALGYGGLKLVKTLLVLAPLLALAWRLRVAGVKWHGIAVAEFVAVAVLLPNWNLRPLLFTTLGLLLVSGWLHDHCTGRRPLDWRLPVTMLLWANLHPGVLTGQGLLVGAVVWEWANRRLKWNPPLDSASLRRLTLYAGLGFAATFVSPAPVDRLLFPFRAEVASPILQIIREMRPTSAFLFEPPYTVWLAYLVAGLTVLTVLWRSQHYRGWEVALLAGVAWLAHGSARYLGDCLLVMLALAVPHFVVLLAGWARTRRRDRAVTLVLKLDSFARRTLNTPWLRFQPFWPAAALAALAVVSLIPPVAKSVPVQEHPNWPRGAADWIEGRASADRPWHVFGPLDYGAYLAWRLPDRVRVYADTRGFFFPTELLEDCEFVPRLEGDWRPRLEKVLARGTDYLLLETTGPRARLWDRLRPHSGEPLFLDHHSVLLSADQVRAALARLDRGADPGG